MSPLRWLVILAAVTVAGWMAFDGTRALVVGDYVTPRSGEHAGELGPWARVVQAAGVEPRSTLMKSIFAGYGFLWLGVVAAFAAGLPWAWGAMVAAAAGALWYLPFGTLLGIVQLALLFLPIVRDGPGA